MSSCTSFFAASPRQIKGAHDIYLKAMQRYYGANGLADAESLGRGQKAMYEMAKQYPLTALILEGCLGCVVHTQQALSVVRRECSSPVVLTPLPYPATSRPFPRKARPRAGRAPGDRYRLVVFGYLGRNRRLESLFAALASMPEKDRFQLDIFGRVDEYERMADFALDLGLDDLVTFHGFVPESELGAALDQADLAINLRYPTVGEASASQLRIWDHALPTLVTRVGMYANLPEAAVAFVRPESEIEDIQAQLRAFLADPARFARMGEEGRRILEQQHNPVAYAQALVDFGARAPHLGRRAAAHLLADRVGFQIGAWLGETPSEAMYARVAREILPLIGDLEEPLSGRPAITGRSTHDVPFPREADLRGRDGHPVSRAMTDLEEETK